MQSLPRDEECLLPLRHRRRPLLRLLQARTSAPRTVFPMRQGRRCVRATGRGERILQSVLPEGAPPRPVLHLQNAQTDCDPLPRQAGVRGVLSTGISDARGVLPLRNLCPRSGTGRWHEAHLRPLLHPALSTARKLRTLRASGPGRDEECARGTDLSDLLSEDDSNCKLHVLLAALACHDANEEWQARLLDVLRTAPSAARGDVRTLRRARGHQAAAPQRSRRLPAMLPARACPAAQMQHL